jgi:hypothetical protein
LDAPQLVVVYPWNSVAGAAAAARAVRPAAAVSAYSPTPAGPPAGLGRWLDRDATPAWGRGRSGQLHKTAAGISQPLSHHIAPTPSAKCKPSFFTSIKDQGGSRAPQRLSVRRGTGPNTSLHTFPISPFMDWKASKPGQARARTSLSASQSRVNTIRGRRAGQDPPGPSRASEPTQPSTVLQS